MGKVPSADKTVQEPEPQSTTTKGAATLENIFAVF